MWRHGETVHHIAGVVHVALKKAIKLKLLKASPMDGVELPELQNREARALDADQLSWYLDAARSHATAARRGELLALQWADLDWTSGVLTISKSLEQTRA